MSQLPPPTPTGRITPGWYADPWDAAPWRWWDGVQWTAQTAAPPARRKPRLPAWLSVPVIIGTLLSMFVVVQVATNYPMAILLSLAPIFIVGPVLIWLDRVEPEPWSARVHAFLWGAFVATAVSGVVNELVGAGLGLGASLVISAPIIEEIMKAIGIWYAVRRKELDGVMDGIVYAGWTALGFAVVENFLYLGLAEQEGQLLLVFVLRGLLTPFAHPLFTAWTGIAIGAAVAKGKPLFPMVFGGLALSMLCHAAWNGAASYGAEISGLVLLGAMAMFVVLFVAVAVTLRKMRVRDQRRFVQLVPWMAQRYGMAEHEISVFADWKQMLATRKQLTRSQRRYFDGVHSALARLVHLHDQPGDTDPGTEQALASRLTEARYSSSS
ncbi:PrsW family glutamic-type intramembrane protease [Ilumatobacter sp.]|uniref:PrsW family glutamic-type intramembrane protease n=1 Tax=Ilumatobacter sp. TaxID=1967498 RepID=UPI003751BAC4